MEKNIAHTGGFWMETELLYPEKNIFNPVVIRPEKGVIFMRTDKELIAEERMGESVKVIAI